MADRCIISALAPEPLVPFPTGDWVMIWTNGGTWPTNYWITVMDNALTTVKYHNNVSGGPSSPNIDSFSHRIACIGTTLFIFDESSHVMLQYNITTGAYIDNCTLGTISNYYECFWGDPTQFIAPISGTGNLYTFDTASLLLGFSGSASTVTLSPSPPSTWTIDDAVFPLPFLGDGYYGIAGNLSPNDIYVFDLAGNYYGLIEPYTQFDNVAGKPSTQDPNVVNLADGHFGYGYSDFNCVKVNNYGVGNCVDVAYKNNVQMEALASTSSWSLASASSDGSHFFLCNGNPNGNGGDIVMKLDKDLNRIAGYSGTFGGIKPNNFLQNSCIAWDV